MASIPHRRIRDPHAQFLPVMFDAITPDIEAMAGAAASEYSGVVESNAGCGQDRQCGGNGHDHRLRHKAKPAGRHRSG